MIEKQINKMKLMLYLKWKIWFNPHRNYLFFILNSLSNYQVQNMQRYWNLIICLSLLCLIFLKSWFRLLRHSINVCSDVTQRSHSVANQRPESFMQTPPPTAADWLFLLFISPDMKAVVVNTAALTDTHKCLDHLK